MKITILGGGISAISLALFLQNKPKIKEINILEKNNKPGGLLRSFKFDKLYYDVGPHIIFSKFEDILELNKKILNKNISKLTRSNKIIYKRKTYIKYPFENQLCKLNKNDLNFALNTFLNNPFSDYSPKNMLQFFLKLFGKGITDLYLRPYNEKIWKFDPSFMDTQMVERIPQPPKKDILKSARGINTEGYKHQLYFYYPKKGGIQSLFDAYKNKLNKKVRIFNNVKINKIKTTKKNQKTFYNNKVLHSDKIVSTIPLNELYFLTDKKNDLLKKTSKNLLYNSIKIITLKIKGNFGGNNFAFMIPDKEIIFHRISKLNFLGNNYSQKNYTYFQIEITYRKNDQIDKMKVKELKTKIINDLILLKFLNKSKDLMKFELKDFKYAYVIYDLNHRKNVDKLINHYKKKFIYCTGRFGSWEYLNSDQVIKQSKNLSQKI